MAGGSGGGGCADGVGALLGCVLVFWMIKAAAIVAVLIFAALVDGCGKLLAG